ncbi:MAG: hypothetical protein Q8L55_14580 [Phycisphaerales bacterium]|nr:hypothetical protein [Phycisphaerales bacterium]
MGSRITPLALVAAAALSGSAFADLQPIFGGTLKALEGNHQVVAPVTSPYYHENSMVTTDVRVWYVYHKFNSDAIGPASSTASVYAAQVRVALTESLQLVAYKDGYLDMNGAVETDGWNDVAAGIKWQFLRDEANQLYAAAGVGYEFRFGESSALQNDSEVRLWASIDKGFDRLHTGATLNYRISTSGANDDNGNCDVLSWHLRADYRVSDLFSPVVEVNGYHIINDSSTGLALNGADVLNLGGTGADATVSAGLGAEFRLGNSVALRGAYEFALTDNTTDLFGTRLTFSVVYTF